MTKTENYNHNYYGGEITLDDFNTTTPSTTRISNQADANELYSKLEKQRKDKQSLSSYRCMSFEELREMKIISNTNGRPSPTLTDEKWQKEFNLRKLFIKPYASNVKRLGGKYSKESGSWNEEKGKYDGATNWQQYCSYINDILKVIRSGQVDYCYYIYQIEELLKFHYSDLRTKYRDGYWEVWLENGRCH